MTTKNKTQKAEAKRLSTKRKQFDKIIKFIDENPDKVRDAWDNTLKEHNERFEKWKKQLGAKGRREVIKRYENDILHREFAGPPAREHLWHMTYTSRIFELQLQLKRGIGHLGVQFVEGHNDDLTMGQSLGITEEREDELLKALSDFSDRLADDDLDEYWFDRLYEHVSSLCKTPEELFMIAWCSGVSVEQERQEDERDSSKD